MKQKFETKVSNLCDYSDAYILVTGDITATGGDANANVAFKNYAPFTRFLTHTNDEHIDTVEYLGIIMSVSILIEYSDNYSDTSGILWQFKRDDKNVNNRTPVGVTINDSSPFKYK